MSKQIDIKKIITIGDLKKSGYKSKSIKDEVRDNLIASIQNKETARAISAFRHTFTKTGLTNKCSLLIARDR